MIGAKFVKNSGKRVLCMSNTHIGTCLMHQMHESCIMINRQTIFWGLVRTPFFLLVYEILGVFLPTYVHVLRNHNINVTFEGLTGNLAVLSNID